MAPVDECENDTAWLPYTWEEWLEDAKRALYLNVLETVRRFGDTLPFVRLTTTFFIDLVGPYSAFGLLFGIFLSLYYQSTEYVGRACLCLGVLIPCALLRVVMAMGALYVARQHDYYRDFLFDARKWKLVRLVQRHGIEEPPRWLCHQMIDEAVRELLDGEQPRPTIDEVNLLMRRVHSRVLLAWSDDILLIG